MPSFTASEWYLLPFSYLYFRIDERSDVVSVTALCAQDALVSFKTALSYFLNRVYLENTTNLRFSVGRVCVGIVLPSTHLVSF